MIGMDSDESTWLYLARKMRRRTLLGQWPSVRRKGNSIVIGVNRMVGCFGIGALIFMVVGGAGIYLTNPQDPSGLDFLLHWCLITGGIGLIGIAAGFSRTGLYHETGSGQLTIR